MIGKFFKHKRTGNLYEVIDDRALIQCSTNKDVENKFKHTDWVVYRSVVTRRVFFRLKDEFLKKFELPESEK